MRAKITLAIGLMVFSPATCWLVACSSGDASKDAGPDGTVGDSGNADTGNADTGVQDSGPSCTAEDGGAACRACCAKTNKKGADFFTAAIYVCGCMKCSPCTTNYCAAEAGVPSQACVNCFDQVLDFDGGSCVGPVGQACAGNADCLAWFQCQAKCK